ncbi:MAG: cache domain-containing protein [Acetobacteraceae bacterium]
MLLVAALIPLIGYAVVTTFVSLEDKRTALEQDALAHTRRISDLVDAEVTGQLGILTTLARSPALDELLDLDRFAELMRREQAAQPLWIAGLLADPEGNLLIDTQLPLPGRVHDMTSLRQVVETGRPLVGNITRGTVSTGMPLRVPVIRDGVARWIVTAVIRPDGIRDRLLSAGLPQEWTESVIDGAGHIVARTGGDPDLIGNPASPAALAARKQSQSGLYDGRHAGSDWANPATPPVACAVAQLLYRVGPVRQRCLDTGTWSAAVSRFMDDGDDELARFSSTANLGITPARAYLYLSVHSTSAVRQAIFCRLPTCGGHNAEINLLGRGRSVDSRRGCASPAHLLLHGRPRAQSTGSIHSHTTGATAARKSAPATKCFNADRCSTPFTFAHTRARGHG